jgi:GT2 family glycosyltransferase
MTANDVTVAIPTVGRERPLVSTIEALLCQRVPARLLLVIDQSTSHDQETTECLERWHAKGLVRWVRRPAASVAGAMNQALQTATTAVVLYLDDDIIPAPDLVAAHAAAFAARPQAWAVAGQVLQPGESPTDLPGGGDRRVLYADLEFPFRSSRGSWVENVMAGNLAVKRERVLGLGGFDENFVPPVAYRFETEFAKRLIRAGGQIWFEPSATVRHLRAPSGGTRSLGSHLTSASPYHGVGDYYYALRCGGGGERLGYMMRRPLREVRTRFHLRHPWHIPAKFIGELRALALAIRLYKQGPRLLGAGTMAGGG